ncbi:MAG: hypothetical protein ABR985_17655 [Methanotrichaceae archaeon]
MRDAVRDKLAAIKTIKYRNIDYEIEEDLELDYKLICQIMDELKREGRLEVL